MLATLDDLELSQKKVLVRCDFNVPLEGSKIVDDTRIVKALPTINYLLENDAQVVLMSHLGRPKEGEYDAAISLQPVANRLAELLGQPVQLVNNLAKVAQTKPKVILLENVRFNQGEKSNDDDLAKRYAALADVFVFDAFGTAHRAQASTTGVAKYCSEKAIGLLMQEELAHLNPLLNHPKQPVLAIIGGSKISTKLDLLQALMEKVDRLIIGGGMANTFLQAEGYHIGASLTENDLVGTAKDLLQKASENNVAVGLPVDVVTVKEFSSTAPTEIKSIADIAEDDMIVDVGPATNAIYAQLVDGAKTIIWNGPVGVVEWESAAKGTIALGNRIAQSNAFSVAGGGDTIAFINQHHLSTQINYLSTGGGAFLAFLEGQILPAVRALEI